MIESLLHKTPLGEIVLAAEDDAVIGLWRGGLQGRELYSRKRRMPP